MFHYVNNLRIVPKLHFKLLFSSTANSNNTVKIVHQQCLNLLTLVATTQSLHETKQSHALAVFHGLLPPSVSISSALILRYAAFRADLSLLSAVFHHTLPYSPSSTFLYNTLLRAHTMISQHVQGFRIYNSMVWNGVIRDVHTYPFLLKLCSDFKEIQKGLEVHATVIKVGFVDNVFVGNTLMLFYGNCGELKLVEKVFDEMSERDLISWNTMIRVFSDNGCGFEGFLWFKNMVSQSGFKVNEASVVTVLPVVASAGDEMVARGIHCFVLKVGLDSRVSVGNALIDAYGKCGNFEASRGVFDWVVEKNEVSWNAIITGFAYQQCYKDALDSFNLMIGEGVKPNSFTISSMMPALVELGCFIMGREVHGYSVRMGMDSDVFVANSLIDMYAKSGHVAKASNVFYKMIMRNIVSWNTMIANFAQNKLELEAIRLVREMQVHGEIPNSVTLTNVLPACARLGILHSGKEIHAKSLRTGASSDLFVSNALTDMYAKCGQLDLAKNVFDISQRDEVSYNILISGYSQTHDCTYSLNLFAEMGTLGLKHDIVSFIGVLSACSNISAIKEGKEIHAFVVRRLFHEHLFVSNSILDFYTKCGRTDLARKVFDRIPHKDVASWNSMILGYGILGELDIAINFFEAMKEDGVEYDSVSYIAVLSACSHGGLLEKGRKYFDDMHARDIKPSQMHYACMVDLLGRSGLIKEAVDLIENLPFKADPNIWGALLGACRLHGHIKLGCWAAEHLLKSKPDHSGYYALLSNVYAEAGRWDEADRVRELMKLRGVKKNPGCSWVQIQDQFHVFIAGERLPSSGFMPL